MQQALRVVAVTVLLFGLSGCNLLVSEEPWFSAADAQPAPSMRDGLWLSATPDCRVDERKPAERWPDCASATFVRGEERWSMQWEDLDARGRRRRTFAGWESAESDGDTLFVANGDHLIVQSRAEGEAQAAPTDEPAPGAETERAAGYGYGAIRLLSHDEAGKVTALEFWYVQCGPLSEPELTPARRRRLRDDPELVEERNDVTDDPFPGLTVVDDNCVADSVDAVRNAAALSEALQPPSQIRWIREGWR